MQELGTQDEANPSQCSSISSEFDLARNGTNNHIRSEPECVELQVKQLTSSSLSSNILSSISAPNGTIYTIATSEFDVTTFISAPHGIAKLSARVEFRRLSTSWDPSRKARINVSSIDVTVDVTAKTDSVYQHASFLEDVAGGFSSFDIWFSVRFGFRIRLPMCFSKGVASDGAQSSQTPVLSQK